ncbi:MAG: PAS domain-containing protein, partial [Planctomycetes bacterium]|nr:PAS domain-containing protein [Planctomycetota bacterium]
MNRNSDGIKGRWKSYIPRSLYPWLKLWQEIVVVLIAAALAFALSVTFDLHDRIHDWTAPYDAWGADDLWLAAGAAAVTTTVLAVLRWRQARQVLLEQRQLIHSLRESEEESEAGRRTLKAVLDASPALIALRDRDLKYRLINRALCEFYGRSEEEILGKDSGAFHPPEHCRQVAAENEWVFEHNEVLSVEREVQSPRGGRWFVVNRNPVRDENGNVIGVLTLSHDITERKKEEMAAAEERNLLRAILDTTPDIVIYRDTDLVYRLCNRSFLDHMGLSEEEVIGKTDRDLFSPGYARITQEEDRWVLEHQRSFRIERLGESRHGEVWFEIHKKPL